MSLCRKIIPDLLNLMFPKHTTVIFEYCDESWTPETTELLKDRQNCESFESCKGYVRYAPVSPKTPGRQECDGNLRYAP